jgi:hypothetical protein
VLKRFEPCEHPCQRTCQFFSLCFMYSSSLSSSVVSFYPMGHAALRPSFLFSQLSLSQTVESYSSVASNQFALNTLLFHL